MEADRRCQLVALVCAMFCTEKQSMKKKKLWMKIGVASWSVGYRGLLLNIPLLFLAY